MGVQHNGRKLIVVLAILSSFAPLSIDFFAPSMPNATRALNISSEALQTTLYLFFIGYGVAPFIWGHLADRLGRRRIMLFGVSIYCLATLGCFFATSVEVLSPLRFIQGAGAAAGVVIARAVLRDIYGAGGATKAISGMFLIMVWIPILSPLVGGYLAAFSWRICFLFMFLIGFVALIGTYLWQMETVPQTPEGNGQVGNRWKAVLFNSGFVRHAGSNMFCIGAMLLFISNYTYLTELHYQFSAKENGYTLAIFSGSVSLGIYMVRLLAPRIGVESTITLGLWIALFGWSVVTFLCLYQVPGPALLLPLIVIACLGFGMVIALSVGQALVPFAYAAGTASALYVCFQSIGASLINFLFTLLIDSTLVSMNLVITLCSLLALCFVKFIKVD